MAITALGPAAGNLLLTFHFIDANVSGDGFRSQYPSGWVVMDAINNTTSSVSCQAAYKVSDGTETDFTITHGSVITRNRTYEISGHGVGDGTYPVFCGWQGANAASGPNTVANEWQAQDIRIFLGTAWENTTPSGGISGYTNDFNAGSGTLGGRVDTKTVSAVNSEDPAAYTTGSGNRAGYVCLVPSEAASPDLTFPIVRNEVPYRSGSGSTSVVCKLPEQKQPGDILVVAIGLIVNVTISSGLPSGWTTEVDVVGGGSGGEHMYVLWKRCDGTEGAGFTLTMSGVSGYGVISCAILNVDSTADVISGTATGGSNNAPDPPNLSADADLWMAVSQNESNGHSAFPANYTHKQEARSAGGASGHSIAFAFRQLAATSENPGTFTAPSSSFWTTATVAFGKANPRFFQAHWA